MRGSVRTAIIGFASGVLGAWLFLSVSGQDQVSTQPPGLESDNQADLLARIAALEEQAAIRLPVPVTDISQNQDAGRSDTRPEPPTRAVTQATKRTQEDRMSDFMRKQQDRTAEQLRAAGWSDAEIESFEDIREKAGLEMEELMFEQWRQSYEENPAVLMGFGRSNVLLDSLGEDRYDQYREATGRPTSLRISSPLRGSAGEIAGLQQGDRIRRFGQNRIYDESDLMRAVLEGKPGDMITLEVERDGAVFHVTVPRGPLGITRTARMLTYQ